jgi:hypothetical protein
LDEGSDIQEQRCMSGKWRRLTGIRGCNSSASENFSNN